MTPQPEFSFVAALKSRKLPRRTKQTRKRVHREKQRLERKSKFKAIIIAIVEAVAASRSVPYAKLFSPERECNAVASARVLVMGLCAALEIPVFITARALSRDWATVYSAEKRCSKLYRESEKFRKEWDSIIKQCRPSDPTTK